LPSERTTAWLELVPGVYPDSKPGFAWGQSKLTKAKGEGMKTKKKQLKRDFCTIMGI
jgi:hypothetical protein